MGENKKNFQKDQKTIIEGGSGMTLWKVFEDDMKASYCNYKWEVDKWRIIGSEIPLSVYALNCSRNIIDVMFYSESHSYICEVKVRGDNEKRGDVEYYREMKIIRAYEWRKEDSVNLATYAANLFFEMYGGKYPDEKISGRTISAAKKWMKNPFSIINYESYASRAARGAWRAANCVFCAINYNIVPDDGKFRRTSVYRAARRAACAACDEMRDKCHRYVLGILCQR